jgi:hypothetical protein
MIQPVQRSQKAKVQRLSIFFNPELIFAHTAILWNRLLSQYAFSVVLSKFSSSIRMDQFTLGII